MRSFRCSPWLLLGVLLGAPLARATVIYPPGEDMGPDSTHHSLGPSLLLGTGKEGFGAGFGLHYQVGALKQHPYFHASLTGEPSLRRYGMEVGTSLDLEGERGSPYSLFNVTADAVLRLERGQLVPALAPGVSLASVGFVGNRWLDMSVKLRAVLPPWHWASSGPRVELSVSFLLGMHPWPRRPISKD